MGLIRRWVAGVGRTWGQVDLAADVTGRLPVANNGGYIGGEFTFNQSGWTFGATNQPDTIYANNSNAASNTQFSISQNSAASTLLNDYGGRLIVCTDAHFRIYNYTSHFLNEEVDEPYYTFQVSSAGGSSDLTWSDQNVRIILFPNLASINLSTLKTDLGLTGTNSGDQDLSGYVLTTAIDTLAELNGIISDATLIDTGDSRLSDARTPTAHSHEGTAILSTGEVGGTKFLREDGDGTSSWQTITGSGPPSGTGMDFWGAALPDGYLWADGQTVSRTTYADLFAALGTTFGAGDGSTTFNLPDKRGRVSVGREVSWVPRMTVAGCGINGTVLGAAGGEETHTLVTAEMPAHTHGYTEPRLAGRATGGTNTSGSLKDPLITDSTGGNGPHNNVQPSIVCNYIIKY